MGGYQKLDRECMKNSIFQFENKIYLQHHGAPWCAPILADTAVDKIEKTMLPMIDDRIYLWICYVDDIFAIVDKEHTETVLEHLNSECKILNNENKRIKFTHEVESNGSPPYLDILFYRNNNESL